MKSPALCLSTSSIPCNEDMSACIPRFLCGALRRTENLLVELKRGFGILDPEPASQPIEHQQCIVYILSILTAHMVWLNCPSNTEKPASASSFRCLRNAIARGALTLKLSVPAGRVDMFAIVAVAVLVVNWLLLLVVANWRVRSCKRESMKEDKKAGSVSLPGNPRGYSGR